MIAGYPRVFLIELGSGFKKLGEWRHYLMAGFEKPEDSECNDYIVFGFLVALFLRAIRGTYITARIESLAHADIDLSPESRPILAHFHEWQAAIALIVLKRWDVNVGTLFTTHATLLGRFA